MRRRSNTPSGVQDATLSRPPPPGSRQSRGGLRTAVDGRSRERREHAQQRPFDRAARRDVVSGLPATGQAEMRGRRPAGTPRRGVRLRRRAQRPVRVGRAMNRRSPTVPRRLRRGGRAPHRAAGRWMAGLRQIPAIEVLASPEGGTAKATSGLIGPFGACCLDRGDANGEFPRQHPSRRRTYTGRDSVIKLACNPRRKSASRTMRKPERKDV